MTRRQLVRTRAATFILNTGRESARENVEYVSGPAVLLSLQKPRADVARMYDADTTVTSSISCGEAPSAVPFPKVCSLFVFSGTRPRATVTNFRFVRPKLSARKLCRSTFTYAYYATTACGKLQPIMVRNLIVRTRKPESVFA